MVTIKKLAKTKIVLNRYTTKNQGLPKATFTGGSYSCCDDDTWSRVLYKRRGRLKRYLDNTYRDEIKLNKNTNIKRLDNLNY